MSKGGFDPVAFSAGVGAGEEATNRANSAAQNAEQAAAMARIDATGAQDTAMLLAVALKNERQAVAQKWIPYGVRMNASIFANKTQKEDLIAALKASDPTNADRIVQASEKHADEVYAQITQPGSEALKMINEQTLREAEEGRLDK